MEKVRLSTSYKRLPQNHVIVDTPNRINSIRKSMHNRFVIEKFDVIDTGHLILVCRKLFFTSLLELSLSRVVKGHRRSRLEVSPSMTVGPKAKVPKDYIAS